MLSVHTMGPAGAGAVRYYANLAREDYYTKGGEPPGQWYGKGCEIIGRCGVVKKDDLAAIMRGFHPNTPGAEKGLVQKAGDAHRAGWDLAFSAPKSVSVLWSQADESVRQKIQMLHAQAVNAALKLAEERVAHTRRGHGGAELESVAGLIVATFEHSTSRDQDPQLHTHCLVANVAPRIDGGWGTLEGRCFFDWKMALGACYRAELAKLLQTEMGLEIDRHNSSFRVVGVSSNVERAFSRRRESIENALEALGFNSAKAAAVAALDTREKKNEVSRPALFAEWQRRGRDMEFGPEQVAEIFAQGRDRLQREEVQQANGISLDGLLNDLTDKTSTFAEHDIWRAVAEQSQGVQGIEDIRIEVPRQLNRADCVHLVKGDERGRPVIRFSTEEMRALERDMVKLCVHRKADQNHLLDSNAIDDAVRLTEQEKMAQGGKSFKLNDEQRKAVLHIAGKSGGVACIRGMAGAGKSTAMRVVVLAYQSAGYEVIGAALAGKASSGLGKEAGIETSTIHGLLAALKDGNRTLSKKSVLIVDEAGMVGSRQMFALLSYAASAGAKVVLVGDERQLQPVDAGGAFKAITRELGVVSLSSVVRQKDAWARETVKQLADGNTAKVLEEYVRRERLITAESRAEALDRMLDDWMRYCVIDPKKTLMLGGTHMEVDDLNGLARVRLKQFGRLQEEVRVSTTRSSSMRVAVGDRILMTRNSRTIGIKNGDLGTLEAIEANIDNKRTKLSIRLDDGRRVVFRLGEYSNIEHGYAITTHKAQSATVDHTFVMAGGMMADREMSYVQLSRHRDTCRVYVDLSALEEMLDKLTPTDGMIRYVEGLAEQKGIALPDDYQHSFVVARRFLDAHGAREVGYEQQFGGSPHANELRELARVMNKSRQKDTTMDYEPRTR